MPIELPSGKPPVSLIPPPTGSLTNPTIGSGGSVGPPSGFSGFPNAPKPILPPSVYPQGYDPPSDLFGGPGGSSIDVGGQTSPPTETIPTTEGGTDVISPGGGRPPVEARPLEPVTNPNRPVEGFDPLGGVDYPGYGLEAPPSGQQIQQAQIVGEVPPTLGGIPIFITGSMYPPPPTPPGYFPPPPLSSPPASGSVIGNIIGDLGNIGSIIFGGGALITRPRRSQYRSPGGIVVPSRFRLPRPPTLRPPPLPISNIRPQARPGVAALMGKVRVDDTSAYGSSSSSSGSSGSKPSG